MTVTIHPVTLQWQRVSKQKWKQSNETIILTSLLLRKKDVIDRHFNSFNRILYNEGKTLVFGHLAR